jgi:hypothetical protein
MDTKSITQPLQSTLTSLNSIQRNTGNVVKESSELATEVLKDQDKDGDLSQTTINLSSESLKLSTASVAKNTSKLPPIENIAQAQKTLSALINSFQNNPSQALGTQSAAPSRVIKELLG